MVMKLSVAILIDALAKIADDVVGHELLGKAVVDTSFRT